ncbi:uncharacterized protein MAM_05324 [Metarhizium album ARSEF 1941]|uniref:DUF3752 domain-containing protein n=1 Tax=Metarhizium album (strain ARSEF 1941) TaxID=1081103 RepID=A0A0B2WRY8_METAS|nr:uncharacterized protein MAM_05324 [Metarhizium album ARSEF 1941]KHN96768.1 hypothetical protein MAM_05324 [Metarhizium album ARSEF 1941]
MPSIGPQLPPSPHKRKRSASPDGRTSPPPARRARPSNSNNNTDEINLSDSDSVSSFGPPAPPSTTTAPTKPCPPADKDSSDAHSDSDSDSDSDSYGPCLPTATSKRPTIGPSLPTPDPALQRDSWMLAPPSSQGYTERDPTRMRNRKFASKPTPTASTAPSSIWTETPEEKLQRQRDALLGRSTAEAPLGASPTQHTQRQQDRDRKIAETIEAHRGDSLYQEHARKRKAAPKTTRDGGRGDDDDDDDDPSKRAFDREKDMAVRGKIGDKARRELISKSANFGGRFQKGSFL